MNVTDALGGDVLGTIPGILTAFTGLIAAVTALIIAIRTNTKVERDVKPQALQHGKAIAALESNPGMLPPTYTQPISIAELQERLRRERG